MSISPGSVYALVGSNGAGKSTLIRLIMNLQTPTSGTATVLGYPLSRIKGSVLNRIGYVSETQEMPDSMTVESFLRYLRPFYPTWDTALERKLTDYFDLPLDRELGHLSRGMRMKAAFVSVLSYMPDLLVLDEPFSGLDPLVRDELIGVLLERTGECTVFLSSHDLAEIETFASHIGYIHRGSLVFSEKMSSLLDRYRQVTVRIGGTSAPGNPMPETWQEIEREGSHVIFKESAFSTEDAAIRSVKSVFPSASNVSFEPLSLRSIFLANARSNRNMAADTPARVLQ